MHKWLNHPWTIAAGGAVLTVVLAEIAPMRLLSGHVIPWLQTVVAFVEIPIQIPRGALLVEAIAVAALVVIGQHVANRLGRRRGKHLFGGLYWKKFANGGEEFRPVCNQCGVTLTPRIEAEQRRDRNDLPFLFTPEYANTLLCPGCKQSIYLQRPWNEIEQDAHAFFASESPVHRSPESSSKDT